MMRGLSILLMGALLCYPQSAPPLQAKRVPPPTVPVNRSLPDYEQARKAYELLSSEQSSPPPPYQTTAPPPTGGLPPKDFVPRTDVALDGTAIRALALASQYRQKINVPTEGKDGSVVYVYGAGSTEIVCAPLRLTSIELQPGEKLSAKPQPGDEARWDIVPSVVGMGDTTQSIVVLRPHESGLDTNLIIATDRRLYYLRIVSKPLDYMSRVSFLYPDDSDAWRTYQKEAGALEVRRQKATEEKQRHEETQAKQITRGYDISGKKHYYFWPTDVWDDGQFTYIKLPDIVKNMDMPVLMVLGPKGLEPVNVNHSDDGLTIIVHRLFPRAVLENGSGKKKQVVTIVSPRKEVK